ncbi:hypothetical protein SY88_09945 [Clostridiales bacterium PH28_bin88]|nr:hypothetical protein SY88_09945 [Clostridiales bacterium PH28_bin88]
MTLFLTILEKVLEINRELNDVIDLSADGLVVSDSDGTLLRMNKAYEQIVGVKAQDFIGKPAAELKKCGVLPEVVTTRVLESGKQENLCLRIRGREVLLTGRPIFDDEGKIFRVVATIRDLNELNMLKEQVQTFKELHDRYLAELAQLRAKEVKVDIVADSAAMRRTMDLALKMAQVESNVLITGESGTGKEVVAKLIHRASQRRDGPFITINCGAIPPALLESELFGYEPGAFTGAKRSGKPGLFETAQGGTIFLDEVAEMPLDLQVKLLRVIQERVCFRLGGHKPVALDVRIIAATNKNLPEMIAGGLFREDLFYRLNVVQIFIPPLRERKEDIPSLVMHFLAKFNKKYHFQKRISPEAMGGLLHYSWPGNVRELENTIERMVVLSAGDTIEPQLLSENGPEFRTPPTGSRLLRDVMEETEKIMLVSAYEKHGSTRTVARALGISQPSVVRKLRKYGYKIRE